MRQIERNYPFSTAGITARRKQEIDSLLQVYPQLKDADYCWSFVNKKMLPTSSFTYGISEISISKKDFAHIVSAINKSGYWQMPYQIKCDSPPTDGRGFFLEANTSKQYNYISFGSCGDDTKIQLAFCKACQQIINYARLGNKIRLYHDDTSEMGPVETLSPYPVVPLAPIPQAKNKK